MVIFGVDLHKSDYKMAFMYLISKRDNSTLNVKSKYRIVSYSQDFIYRVEIINKMNALIILWFLRNASNYIFYDCVAMTLINIKYRVL